MNIARFLSENFNFYGFLLRKLSDSTPYIPYKPATVITSPAAPVITNIVDTDKQVPIFRNSF